MRVLLDEQLPRQLAPYLTSHAVRIVQQQGLSALGDTSEGLHGATRRELRPIFLHNAPSGLINLKYLGVSAQVELRHDQATGSVV